MPHSQGSQRPRQLLLAALIGGMSSMAWCQTEGPECRVEGAPLDMLRDRAAIISRYEQLPELCLKDMFLACSEAAGETLLDGGSAAACSLNYEALLRRSFGGDFNALMVWWRAEVDDGD